MSGFTFNFAVEDEEDEPQNTHLPTEHAVQTSHELSLNPALPPTKAYAIHEWLSEDFLPSAIEYSPHPIRAPSFPLSSPSTLPRRAVFDIRIQLKAESGLSSENDTLADIDEDDLRPGVYEGGLKTWECALDLVNVLGELVTSGQLNCDGITAIELGAGSALPSCALLYHILKQQTTTKAKFILADYNLPVLQLCTLSNVLLAVLASRAQDWEPENSAQLDEPTLSSIQSALAESNIDVSFLHGAWSASFVEIVSSLEDTSSQGQTLILASETIYSPDSIAIFTDALLSLLRNETKNGRQARALVAAKSFYFGVGGSVDDFERELVAKGGRVTQKWAFGSGGVGRQVLCIDLST